MAHLRRLLTVGLAAALLPSGAHGQEAPDDQPQLNLAARSFLSLAGSAALSTGAAYSAYLVKCAGDRGCEAGAETAIMAISGSILGAALGATAVSGDRSQALLGSVLGTAIGFAALWVFDTVGDPDGWDGVITVALPQSLITAWFAGR